MPGRPCVRSPPLVVFQNSRIWNDQSFKCRLLFDGLQRLAGVLERITAADHLTPRLEVAEARGQGDRPMKVIVARTPAALELDVFAVQLPVRMDLDRPVIRVMSADDHTSAVTHHVETLLDGVGRTAGFDHDVNTTTTGETAHCLETRDRREIETQGRCGAHLGRVFESRARSANGDDLACAR